MSNPVIQHTFLPDNSCWRRCDVMSTVGPGGPFVSRLFDERLLSHHRRLLGSSELRRMTCRSWTMYRLLVLSSNRTTMAISLVPSGISFSPTETISNTLGCKSTRGRRSFVAQKLEMHS